MIDGFLLSVADLGESYVEIVEPETREGVRLNGCLRSTSCRFDDGGRSIEGKSEGGATEYLFGAMT